MRLTVVAKIILGFAVFCGLLILTGLLSYAGLSDIRGSAVSVVENKMPMQSQMMEMKSETLTLATIIVNGYHEDSIDGLNQVASSLLRWRLNLHNSWMICLRTRSSS